MPNKTAALLCLGLTGMLSACGDQSSEPTHPGKAVYDRYCFACHQAGIAGAPALSDKEAWVPRLAAGRDALLASVIEGIAPGMPPRGACPACTDEALAVAVDYMVLAAE